MKKSFLLVLIGILAASMAWGNATVLINATVTEKFEVTATTPWTITLDNSGTAITNASQGILTVKASKSNYTVTFSSTNSGALKNGGTEAIPYKIQVNTSAWTEGVQTNNLSSYTQLTTPQTIVFNKKTPTAGKTFNIGFNIEAYTDYYIDGEYTDTLTISIAVS